MARVKKPQAIRPWLIPKLRRLSLYWPERKKVLDAAKVWVEIGKHKNGNPLIKRYFLCETPDCGTLCGEEREGAVDHIKPVVDVKDGFVDWNIYIPGLLCDSDNLQFICFSCHEEKTRLEDIERNKK